MKRVMIPAIVLGLFSIGCAGDTREAHINNVLTFLNNTSSHLGSIKKKLGEVVKKDKVVADDIKDVQETVEKIREEGKLLQDLNRKIMADTDKTPLTKDDMETYQKKFAGSIEEAMRSLGEEERAVIDLVDRLEDKNKSLAVDLRKKLKDANGEFQSIISAK